MGTSCVWTLHLSLNSMHLAKRCLVHPSLNDSCVQHVTYGFCQQDLLTVVQIPLHLHRRPDETMRGLRGVTHAPWKMTSCGSSGPMSDQSDSRVHRPPQTEELHPRSLHEPKHESFLESSPTRTSIHHVDTVRDLSLRVCFTECSVARIT